VAVASGLMVTWSTYLGGRVLIGLGERTLAAAMLGMLIVVAIRAIRLHRPIQVAAPVLAA